MRSLFYAFVTVLVSGSALDTLGAPITPILPTIALSVSRRTSDDSGGASVALVSNYGPNSAPIIVGASAGDIINFVAQGTSTSLIRSTTLIIVGENSKTSPPIFAPSGFTLNGSVDPIMKNGSVLAYAVVTDLDGHVVQTGNILVTTAKLALDDKGVTNVVFGYRGLPNWAMTIKGSGFVTGSKVQISDTDPSAGGVTENDPNILVESPDLISCWLQWNWKAEGWDGKFQRNHLLKIRVTNPNGESVSSNIAAPLFKTLFPVETFLVPASAAQTFPGITLQTGQPVTLTASGSWNIYGNPLRSCGPKGSDAIANTDTHNGHGPWPKGGVNEGCLLVYVNGVVARDFTTSNASNSLYVTGPGVLSFGPNDNYLGDNYGSLQVTIELDVKSSTANNSK